MSLRTTTYKGNKSDIAVGAAGDTVEGVTGDIVFPAKFSGVYTVTASGGTCRVQDSEIKDKFDDSGHAWQGGTLLQAGEKQSFRKGGKVTITAGTANVTFEG